MDTPISQVLQRDAEELLQTVPEDDFVPWPIISKEGELAALLGLVSEDMIDMQIDTDYALDILDTKGFRRTRVIDDDCIELVVNVKLNEKGIHAVEAPEPPHAHSWTSNISTGTTTEGGSSEKRTAKKREKVLSASALISAVENAGRDGITPLDLKVGATFFYQCFTSILIFVSNTCLELFRLIRCGHHHRHRKGFDQQ